MRLVLGFESLAFVYAFLLVGSLGAQSLYIPYTFTTLAGHAGGIGSADGTGSAARFYYPWGVATDSSGNVYVADSSNCTIRKITPSGVVTTLAGLAGSSGSADGTGSLARFFYPSSVAADASGNVHVADSSNNTIRKITPAGVVTTLAGLAGTRGGADGTGNAARLHFPFGVATDSPGNVYVADTDNHTIRKISPAGGVTTLAGLAGINGNADGTGSAAQFDSPFGVATDSSGGVYVVDNGNNTIRKGFPPPQLTILLSGVPPSGIVLTWPTNAAGFTLQSATNLVSPLDWNTNSTAPAVIGGQNTVTNPITGPQQFFRLSR